MQILKSLSEIKNNKNTVLTVGTFDGLHLGHQSIIQRLITSARQNNYRSVVVTFDPHPRTVVSSDYRVGLLTTTDEKVEVLSKFEIEFLLILEFTKKFSELSSVEFIKNYLVDGTGISEFIIGHDHKFGKSRDGDESTLKKLGERYNFNVEPVEPALVNNELVSSTRIRKFLESGHLEEAHAMLGRRYSFSGIIVAGATRGRILGFPTANIKINSDNKLLPQNGVYAVECFLMDELIYGIMNIGYRPTFESDGELVIEVHLFDYSKEVYGENIKVNLIERLRDEKKFGSKEELIYQIKRDKRKAIQIIGALINPG
ncbi:MAG: bifunctional riboflavin kinase/FAD synthetase [Melioribacteraceae bacterium]|nr:bifunctional riboflavin kinase/FAD synthetase [Melioribacteraceae bacterium]